MRVDARHCCSLFRRVGAPGFVGARNWSSVVEGGGGGGGGVDSDIFIKI